MVNPIVRREANSSLRTWKSFFNITFYVLFIAFVSYVYINGNLSSSYYYGFDPQAITYLYALLSGMQFGYLFIIVPALCAGSISGERERQTLDILLTTKMTPFAIVFGKLVSSMGTLMLMIIATLPVYAVLFYYGGASVLNLLAMTGFMITTAFFVGSVAIFFSAVYKRTMTALIVTYFIFSIIIFGTYIGYICYVQIYLEGIKRLVIADYAPYIYAFLSVNPGSGFFSIIDEQLGSDIFQQMTLLWWNSGRMTVPMWVISPILNIGLGLAFLKLAALRINPLNVRNDKRIQKQKATKAKRKKRGRKAPGEE